MTDVLPELTDDDIRTEWLVTEPSTIKFEADSDGTDGGDSDGTDGTDSDGTDETETEGDSDGTDGGDTDGTDA